MDYGYCPVNCGHRSVFVPQQICGSDKVKGMKLSAILEPLLRGKASPETILDIVLAFEKAQEEEQEKGREKARARWHKWKDNKPANGSKRLQTPTAVSNTLVRAEDSSSTKQITRKEEDTSPSVRSSRGTRIPDDFAPDIDAAISEGLSRQEAERQAASFVDYWKAKPGKDAMKLDWPATWRIWFRRRLDDARKQSTAPPRKQTVGQQARDELKRMGLFDDTTSPQTRHIDQSDGSPGFAGTGIARRIAIASSR